MSSLILCRTFYPFFRAACAVILVIEAGSLRPAAADEKAGQLAGNSEQQGSGVLAKLDLHEPGTPVSYEEGSTLGLQRSVHVSRARTPPVKDQANQSKDGAQRLKDDGVADNAPQVNPPKDADQQSNKMGAAAKEKDKEHYARKQSMEVDYLTRQFLYFSPFALVLAACFEAVHLRWSGVDWQTHDDILDAPPDEEARMRKLNLHGAGSLAHAYFCNDGKILGTTCVCVICALILVHTIIAKKMNIITGIFWDALEERDQNRFFSGILCFVAMVPCAFTCQAYQQYITSMLTIHWRHSLTDHFQRMWMQNSTFCVGQLRAPGETRGVENPDQRIEEDIPNFVGYWTSLVFGLFASIPVFIVWMPIVLELTPSNVFGMQRMPVFRGWLLIAAIIWCFTSSVISHYVGRNVITLTYARERYAANFRMGLARIRYNADDIAVLHAEQHEFGALQGHFARIKRTFWESMIIGKRRTIVGFLLDQGSMLFPLLTLGHAYFSGGMHLGTFMRIRVAVDMVQGSMNYFVDRYTDIAHFRAIANRLNEMIDHCEKVKGACLLKPEVDTTLTPPGMKLMEAKGKLPTGQVLWNIEDLVFEEGAWTMVKGVEGSGKTTLMKMIAGAWPVQEAARCLVSKAIEGYDSALPEKQLDDGKTSSKKQPDDKLAAAHKSPEMLCVPVGAHRLRALFHLKAAACYPDPEDIWTDSEVAEALQTVGLGKLLESKKEEGQSPTSDAVDVEAALHNDFGDRTLSAGESQRLELAHVLLVRPRWCFLDEPLSHIRESERAALFSSFREKLRDSTTVITITHNIGALSSLHDRHLEVRDGAICDV